MKNYLIKFNEKISNAIIKLNLNNIKCLVVIDNNGHFFGTLTDGDLRKSFLQGTTINSSVSDVCQRNSYFVFENEYSSKKLEKIFEENDINLIPILDKKRNIKSLKIRKLFSKKNNAKKNLTKFKRSILVIMAGGEGLRMSPFTKILPKALIPLKNNKTILEYIVDHYIIEGFQNFLISINKSQKIIPLYLKQAYPKKKFIYNYEDFKLGTAGALRSFYDKNEKKYDYVLVSNCDIFAELNFDDLYQLHTTNKYDITTVISDKTLKVPYGVCELSKNGKIKKIEEKPSTNYHVNVGIYFFNIKIFKLIPKNKQFDMNLLLELAIDRKFKVGSYKLDDGNWYDVGQWNEYDEAINKLT